MSDQQCTPPETAVEALAHTVGEAIARGACTGQMPLFPWPELTRNAHDTYVRLAQAALVWTYDNPCALEDGAGSDDDDVAR